MGRSGIISQRKQTETGARVAAVMTAVLLALMLFSADAAALKKEEMSTQPAATGTARVKAQRSKRYEEVKSSTEDITLEDDAAASDGTDAQPATSTTAAPAHADQQESDTATTTTTVENQEAGANQSPPAQQAADPQPTPADEKKKSELITEEQLKEKSAEPGPAAADRQKTPENTGGTEIEIIRTSDNTESEQQKEKQQPASGAQEQKPAQEQSAPEEKQQQQTKDDVAAQPAQQDTEQTQQQAQDKKQEQDAPATPATPDAADDTAAAADAAGAADKTSPAATASTAPATPAAPAPATSPTLVDTAAEKESASQKKAQDKPEPTPETQKQDQQEKAPPPAKAAQEQEQKQTAPEKTADSRPSPDQKKAQGESKEDKEDMEVTDEGPKRFLVRSVALTADYKLVDLVNRLIKHGFHPVVLEETLDSGEKFFYLDMGRFDDVQSAVQLLNYLRAYSDDFFVLGTGGAGGPQKGLISTTKMEEVFPAGGEGGDLLALLSSSDFAVGLVDERRLIREPDPTTEAAAAGEEPAGVDAPAGATGPGVSVTRPTLVSYQGIPLEKRLRNIAWEMRGRGFDVYLEDETFARPQGVLVGVFQDQDEALELSEELQGYGYSVNVIFESGIEDAYFVYADPESSSREITVVGPDELDKYRVRDEFAPPEQPAADALLDLSSNGS